MVISYVTMINLSMITKQISAHHQKVMSYQCLLPTPQTPWTLHKDPKACQKYNHNQKPINYHVYYVHDNIWNNMPVQHKTLINETEN